MFAIGKTAENLKIEKLTALSILTQYRDSNRGVTNFQGCNATYIIIFVNVGNEEQIFRLLPVFACCRIDQQLPVAVSKKQLITLLT